MQEADFLAALQSLLAADVAGLDARAKAEVLERAIDSLVYGETPPAVEMVPFIPGRRPTDEAAHPWLGSSDQAALVLDSDEDNVSYLLFALTGASGTQYALDATLSFDSLDGEPLEGWDHAPLTPTAFGVDADRRPCLTEVQLDDPATRRLVLAISPRAHLSALADRELGFNWLFLRELHAQIRLTCEGTPVAAATARIDACDVRCCGSLYRRIVSELLEADTALQATAAGVENPGCRYHPWYPVLTIGSEKAGLYLQALIGDIVHKRRHLTDPGWLLRVGVYLEFLTTLGIIEAVREDHGDLLRPEERAVFESSPTFAEIRRRIDPEAWRHVWSLRDIAFARRGSLRTGPVAAANLLSKRRATLTFLHAHHEDLKHAIELAGPNHRNSQETWQRVFRDAERAVMRTIYDAFPELEHMPRQARDFVLWHRCGQFGSAGSLRLPPVFTRLFADKDGLFASAGNQYRASMNEVADWAKARGLMDHTGDECIPISLSLLHARVEQPSRFAALQRRDGYTEGLEAAGELLDQSDAAREDVAALLAGVPIFRMVDGDQLRDLAATARRLELGPLERIVIQGQVGTSLFVVAEGQVEVMLRRQDGLDWPVATMERGAVVGEMSLLSGERRSATVRAVDGAVLYEVGHHQYEPLLRANPQWVDEVAAIVEERLRERRERLRDRDAELARDAVSERIRRRFFSD